jgi:branched-chain amino acid transport system permease protein
MAQLLVSGISLGCVYALVALGFVLLYRAVGAINFAQGELVSIGAYVYLWTTAYLHLPLLIGWVASIVAAAIAGIGLYYGIYRPLRRRPFLPMAIATLGVGIAVRGVLSLLFGPEPKSVPSPVSTKADTIAGVAVSPHELLIVGIVVVLVVAQALVLGKTFPGRATRAVAEDQEMARVLGIRANRLILFTFAYTAGLAGLAGVLLSPQYFVSLDLGFTTGLIAITGAIVGGFGSLPGALAGCLAVSLANVLGAAYISTAFGSSFGYVVLLAILIARPTGIFNVAAKERV